MPVERLGEGGMKPENRETYGKRPPKRKPPKKGKK